MHELALPKSCSQTSGKAIDGVSLLALTMKNGCVESSSSESTAGKKMKKSLFHLISAACLTGGASCSGFFLFSIY